MTRRTTKVTITDLKSRDHGKAFKVTEMAADQAERWAYRVLILFGNASANVPDELLNAGMAGLHATLPGLILQGIRSITGVRYEEAAPILDAMNECISFCPKGTDAEMALAGAGMSQVEEVSTLMRLRYEVLSVHLGFSLADALSKSAAAAPPETPAA